MMVLEREREISIMNLFSPVPWCHHVRALLLLLFLSLETRHTEKIQGFSDACILTLTWGWVLHFWGPLSCKCEDACIQNTLYHLETHKQVCQCNILVQDKYVAQFATFVLQHPPQVHLRILCWASIWRTSARPTFDFNSMIGNKNYDILGARN